MLTWTACGENVARWFRTNAVALRVIPALLAIAPQVFAQVTPAAKTSQACSISGVVLDSISGAPLGNATILLERLQAEPNGADGTTTSDSSGRFKMVNVPAGLYKLSAWRSGYPKMAYGARRAGAEGWQLRLQPGESTTNVKIMLTPGATISGTVRDGHGEVIEGAEVILARFGYQDAAPAVRRVATTMTNDHGEYRFSGLIAGKYYLAADLPLNAAGLIDYSSEIVNEAPALTLYPGVSDLAQALRIEATPGGRISGVDLALMRSPVYCVRGVMENLAPGRLAVVELVNSRNPGLTRRLTARPRNSSGEFEFRGVAPGSYFIGLSNEARSPITVGAGDIEGIRVAPQPRVSVARMIVTTESGAAPNLPLFDLQLASENAQFSFRIDGRAGVLPAGRYSILRLYPTAPSRYYVKQLRAGGVDVLAGGLTVAPGAAVQFTAVLASDGGSVVGMVRGEKDEPAPGATVVLVPDKRESTYLFQSTLADQYGRYEFSAIPPGKYRIYVWEAPEPEMWYDPSFLKTYEQQGREVTLEPKDNHVIDLRIADRPEA